MLFLNPWLLAGLAAAGIPIVIHLVRRQAARPIDWGAMRFLMDTLVVRRRKMEWEDLLLMAARCLLLALVALAVARPFVPPNSSVPWLFVLPAAAVGIALFGGSFVLSSGRWRWSIRGGSLLLLIAAGALVWLEDQLNLKRFEASGRRDVALVIDASDSMGVHGAGGRTAFEQALAEARELVTKAPRGTAFTVVLGGPAPEAVTAAPLTHRADVLGALEGLEMSGGDFAAHEALGMATLALAEGLNASKEIVVFTDGQRSGWRLENPGLWKGLEEAWETMPARPRLLVRSFGIPATFRNVALGGFETSRSVVGTDRPVGIRVTVENTGAVPVTPGPVELEIDGRSAGEQPVGLLGPGERETVSFRHRFAEAGPAVLRARIAAKDDLAADDRLERVIAVRDKLRVLIVDGNASAEFFERGSGFTALALAPGALGGGNAERYLMEPEVIAAGRLRAEDLEERDVVVLADVARLPSALADRLEAKIAGGAGLMVIAGPRVEPGFYNAWSGVAGPVVPLPLGEEIGEAEGVRLAPSTYVHEALEIFADSGDLDEAVVRRWRRLGEPVEGAAKGAALASGDAFLGSRIYGNGRTLVVACAFDARSGSLPAKRAFVPLVHELVTWTAGGGVGLNVDASWRPSVRVGDAGGGLQARYFRGHGKRRKIGLERVDPTIDFEWMHEKPGKGLPADNYEVVWSGRLLPPVSGTYRFRAEVDDELELRIGDGAAMRARLGAPEMGEVKLEAGKPVPMEAVFREEGGEAYVRLLWTPPGGNESVIPAGAFLPGEVQGETLRAVDPRGRTREALVSAGRRGEELAISGIGVPGVYEVEVGEAGKRWLTGWDGGVLPVAVTRDEAESRLVPLGEEDREMIRSRIDLLEPGSVADMVGVLEGKGFGREIWKWVAGAALGLFLLESALARWVSRSRRVSEDVRVEFGDHPAWEGGRR